MTEGLIDNVQWKAVEASMCGSTAGPALFVKAAIACVVANSVEIQRVFKCCDQQRMVVDHAVSELALAPGAVSERFRCCLDSFLVLTFLLDLDGLLRVDDLRPMLMRMLQIRTELANSAETRVHGLVIVNHQRHLEPGKRLAYRHLDDALDRLLRVYGLTLVFTTDLWRYINAARAIGWSPESVRASLLRPGFLPCHPPDSVPVGEVVKFFPRYDAYGIRLDPGAEIRAGVKTFVRSDREYELRAVASLEVDNLSVADARGSEDHETPTFVAVKFNPTEPRIREGATVFMVNSAVPA
jgi:hypothetical protein